MLDKKQHLERSFQEFDILPTKQSKTPMALNSKEETRKYSGKATASELFNYQKLVDKCNFSSCMA